MNGSTTFFSDHMDSNTVAVYNGETIVGAWRVLGVLNEDKSKEIQPRMCSSDPVPCVY